MAKSIGIDLGTTNSVAAITRVQTEILQNAEGEAITPSCVTMKKRKLPFSKDRHIVGKHALEWKKQDPENTIFAVKRLMGRSIHNPEIQKIIESGVLPYRVQQHSKGSKNSLAVVLQGQEWTPEQLSSLILKKIRDDAENVLGDTVDAAVITVPAYFNDKQKHATRNAAAQAGLKVRRLLPEPTAAAVSFGVDTVAGDEARTVLVFDFGGGTFDVSVLTMSGGQFLEQGKGGDMWLGGEEIDRLVMDHVLQETAREYGLDDIYALIDKQDASQRNLFWAELKSKVEAAKIQLSTEEETSIEILGLLEDEDGDKLDVDCELDRGTFDALIEPVLGTMIRLIRQILESLHFTPDLIDQVLMVGGSSCIPRIITAMQEEFGTEKVLVHERPMLAIAEGAAILSHRLADNYECPQCGHQVGRENASCDSCGFDLDAYIVAHSVVDIVHAAAHDYYIYLENAEKHLLVEKNTPLPFETTEVFKLVHPEQKLVHLKFVNIVNEEDESIGDLWLGIEEEKAADKDDSQDSEIRHVVIKLHIDENNLIEVTASLQELPDVQLSKTLSRGQADEQLFLDLEQAITKANEEGYSRMVVVDLQHHALAAIRDIHRIVSQETGHVDETMYERAKMKIDKAERMAAEEKVSKPVLNYAYSALNVYGEMIPDEIQKTIQNNIRKVEDADAYSGYEETVQAVDELHESLKEIGGIHFFMQLDNAAKVCSYNGDRNREQKFLHAKHEMMQAMAQQDTDKFEEILNRILPEAQNVVESFGSQGGKIHKDITR